MEQNELAVFNAIPQPAEGSPFTLTKVERIAMPHPYCITSKHVEVAADRFSGMLRAEAIRAAEKSGAKCDICRVNRLNLSYDEHESNLTLFIEVPLGKDLNAVPGLHAYLLSIKEQAIALGIQGFAFPPKA
jgi:hypothetical protein